MNNYINKKLPLLLLIMLATNFSLFAQGHTFSSFDTGTITGGGAEYTKSLNVTGLTNDFLFVVVTADFIPGANSAFSQTMQMQLDNNSSTIYKTFGTATSGALANSNLTTLVWSGLLEKTYSGGTNLTIKFKDTYSVGGTYTSELQNVSVTIYVTPTPIQTFTSFNTSTITGAGSAYDKILDVSGLIYDYLFYVVSADFVSGTKPAWSQTIQMQLDNNGSTIYKTFGNANTGVLLNSNSTTLFWHGVMEKVYSGGGALRASFKDTFTDGDGPYNSALNNVSVKIYPAPIPVKTFATFDTGTITGAGAEIINSLDVSSLTNNYLFYVISGNFIPGANSAFSQTINMELDNGASTIYSAYSGATSGALNNSNATTLFWTGVMYKPYNGGGTLRIKIKDTFNDVSGPYSSELQNVSVSIYSEPSTVPLPVELTSFIGNSNNNSIKLTWQTATEVNNYGFEIERQILKQVQNDSEVWEKVGFVEGHGNSNSPKKYSFIDESTQSGTYSYRLKQIDFDGKFEYSNVVEVIVESIKDFSLDQNFPNPFNPTTMINYSVPTKEFVSLKVYDILGNEVTYLVNENKEAGNYEVSFDASNYPSGLYVYSITAGNFNQVRKMMLVK